MSRWGAGGGGGATPRGSLPSTPRSSRKREPSEEQTPEDIEKEEAMANAERDLAEDAEWKRIQQNTFTRWVNEHLRQVGQSIEDLEKDFSNGLKLIALLEVLSGKKMPRYNKKTNFRSQQLENVSIALTFLENEGIHLVNIDSTDITDCKIKLILGLIWTLILHYSISMPMYDGPELGGPIEDKTPKQRLMNWLQNKMPNVPVNNFTSDWQDGRKVGALVDSVAPGLCPDWESWDPNDPIRNATEAMDLADNWLGVPKLLTPEEMTNPNVDEMSMMTYLSQFPNAKVKDGSPLRSKAVPSKVRAYGPGLEPTGVVAKAPANFTVETFGAGDGDLNITAKGPNDMDYKVDKNYNNDRKKSYSCSYYPDKEGQYTVNVLFSRRHVPNSPFPVTVEGFAGDASKVTAAGPGLEPEGVVAGKPTYFEIFTAGAGKGKPEVVVLDPAGRKDSVPAKILPTDDPDIYRCEYMPTQLGVHSVNVFFAGNPIPNSPFGVKVGPASNAGKVTASGRGLQPHGIRVLEQVDFKVFTEGAGEGVANVKIIGPGGITVPTTHRNIDPHTIEYKYTPEKEGKHVVMITWAGKEIPRSPFNVTVSPQKSSKIKAYGPGLKGGVVDMPAKFTVDPCGETGTVGFNIEGPSKAKITPLENDDGTLDVEYVPTAPGQYVVHILCDKDDIPNSPYMAQILPKTDYDPSLVRCYGPGIEETVVPKQETHFTIDTTQAGKAPLDVSIVDDYGERKPLWKDNNGVHDPLDGGIMSIKILKARDLIKSDMIGKSDPYAIIKHGAQKYTTQVVKNTQDPEWNYEAQVTLPDLGDQTIFIEVFDKDKIGKDKSLGSTTFDTAQVIKQKEIPSDWYPLEGVKSGTILISADFLPAEPSLYKEPELVRKTSHANLEVKRPVLELKSDGIYECRYVPRKTQKQVVNVNFGGVAVPGSPFHVKVDDPTDPTKVRVYGPGVEDQVKANKPTNFTVDCSRAGPGDMETIVLDEKQRALPAEVKDNKNGTYEVAYKPTNAGPHTVLVKYDGREVPQSPIKVHVRSELDLRKVKVKNLDAEAFVGCTSDFDVDCGGLGPIMAPVAATKVTCDVKGPDGESIAAVTVGRPNEASVVNVCFTPVAEGPHKVEVNVDYEPLQGSPYPVKVRGGCDPSKVKAYGPGLEAAYVNEPNEFTVETKNAGKGALEVDIDGEQEAVLACKDNLDGGLDVEYSPVVEGPHAITVKYDDKHIPGSPFKVDAKDRGGSGGSGPGAAGLAGQLKGKDGGDKGGPDSSRKPSSDRLLGKGGAAGEDDDIPYGNLKVKLIKGKELIKADMIGKSDPYAKLKYASQQFKTKTVKNSLEPQWNHESDFRIPEGHETVLHIEVFDSDRFGKDKSLGKVGISVAQLAREFQTGEGRWYPLTGVKSGQVLLTAEFLPEDPSFATDGGRKQSARSGLPGAIGALGGDSDDDGSGMGSRKGSRLGHAGGPDGYGDRKGSRSGPGGQGGSPDGLGDRKGSRGGLGGLGGSPDGLGDRRGSQGGPDDGFGDRKGSRGGPGGFGEGPDGLDDRNGSRGGPGGYGSSPDGLGDRKGSQGGLGGRGGSPDGLGDRKGSRGGLGGRGGSPDGLGDRKGSRGGLGGRGGSPDDGFGDRKDSRDGLGSRKGSKDLLGDRKGSQDGRRGLGGADGDNDGLDDNSDPSRRGSRGGPGALGTAGLLGKDRPQAGRGGPRDDDDIEDEYENGRLGGKRGGDEGLGPDGGLLGSGDEEGDRDGLGRPKGGRGQGRGGDGLGSDDDDDAADGKGRGRGQGQHGDGAGDPRGDGGPDGSGKGADLLGPGGPSNFQGKILVDLVKGKDLIKADIIGKSDPYAVVKFGKQKDKTNTIKNTQNPQWDFSTEFASPDGGASAISVEVFDEDKLGKDKSLGKVDVPLEVLADMAVEQVGKWFPLKGVKSGEVLLYGDLLPQGEDGRGRNPLPSKLKGGKGDGAADASKVKAYGPGLEKGKPVPGLPTQFLVDSSKTGPAAIDVNVRDPNTGASLDHQCQPNLAPTNSPGFVDVDYLTPDDGQPYIVDVKYGGQDIPGSPFKVVPAATGSGGGDGADGRRTSGQQPAAGLYPGSGVGDGGLDGDRLGGPGGRPSIIGGGDNDKLHVDLIKAKNLVKADLMGKSDPYAVVEFGKQKAKTDTIKNTLEPQWDFSKDFDYPDGDARTFSVEVFDHDKIGKDKSLGKVDIDLANLGQGPQWYPLKGVKSGEVLLNADLFSDRHGEAPGGYDQPAKVKGGKGDGPADPSKVKAFGPGLEKGKVFPGVPTHFKIDSSKTGPASIDVGLRDPESGADLSQLVGEPKISPTDAPGVHEVDYLPPDTDSPFLVDVLYGGQDIPGTPFQVKPVHDPTGAASRKASQEALKRKGSQDVLARKASIDADGLQGRRSSKDPLDGRRSSQDPLGRRDSQDALGRRQSHDPLNRRDSQDSLGRKASQDPYGRKDSEDALGRRPSNDPLGRRDSQEGAGRRGSQDPLSRRDSQDALGRKSSQDPYGRKDSDDPTGRKQSQDPYFRKDSQDPLSRRDSQDPSGRKSSQDPYGRKDSYDPHGDDPSGRKGSRDLLGGKGLKDMLGRRGSKDPLGRKDSSGRAGDLGDLSKFDGTVQVDLIRAKDLVKRDLMGGKSDPYAVLKLGKQKEKTDTIKNTQDPQWDFSKEFRIPDGKDKTLNIDVYDHDKLGIDRSLGKLELDVEDLASAEGGKWFPLTGVKSGQVLLCADLRPGGQLGDGQAEDRPSVIKGGKGDGPADASKVKAFGPGLEKGKVFPGEPTDFTVDSTKTGPATLDVDLIDPAGNPVGQPPKITPEKPGVHNVSYLPPNEDEEGPYQIEVKYGGQDVPGSPFKVTGGGGDDPSLGKKHSSVDDSEGRKGSLAGGAGVLGRKLTGSGTAGGKSKGDEGKLVVDLIKARDLMKTDKSSKSDPYAVVKFGKQKDKTNVIKNTQDPYWDHRSEFKKPDGNAETVSVEVFDHDRLGRDKSLGKAEIPVNSLPSILNDDEGMWIPLQGVPMGEVLVKGDFVPLGEELPEKAGAGDEMNDVKGGKGDGPADASKVKAYGPGLEKENILPGKPTGFKIDSSKTGPAPIEVDITGNNGKPLGRKPSIAPTNEEGVHDVSYVPPPVGEPYQVDVKYGGQDVPGSPFNMVSDPNMEDVDFRGQNVNDPGDRKGSKIGVSVNPDAENMGKIHVTLIEAKNLSKSDILGKSDPYAILSHGNQKFKTNTVKNSQNPKWNYNADFNVPDHGNDSIKVEIFDSDKIGKDKSLGSACFDVHDVMSKGMIPPSWYPLKGSKSGEVLMSADFEPLQAHDGKGGVGGMYAVKDGDHDNDKLGMRKKDSVGPAHSKQDADGVLHVEVLEARKLAKADILGKSDPYAVINIGDDQVFKTDVAKNTCDPKWNFGADFNIYPDADDDVLSIKVLDKDRIGKDKSLGDASIPLYDLIHNRPVAENDIQWVPLNGVKSGEVCIATSFHPSDNNGSFENLHGRGRGRQYTDRNGNEPKSRYDHDPAYVDGGTLLTPEGEIYFSLNKARNLPKGDLIGKSDPYAVISCGDQKSKTAVVKNNLNPEWNHNAVLPLTFDSGKNSYEPIQIDVYDADKHGKDKLLGTSVLDVNDIRDNGPVENVWCPLKNGKSGDVQVSASLRPLSPSSAADPDARNNQNVPAGGAGKKASGAGVKNVKDMLKRGDSKQFGDLTPGTLNLDLHKAKDLIKADLMGKSDPYAVVSYDDTKTKTKVVKNDLNPDWNFEVSLPIKPNSSRNVQIEVFDADRFGKDKSLGTTKLDVAKIADGNPLDKEWIPLEGVKTGKIQVSADFVPGTDAYDPSGNRVGDDPRKMSESGGIGRKLTDTKPNNRMPGSEEEKLIPGHLSLDIIEAKDLVKADLISKSDPYAVVKYDNELHKTEPIKNNQNPKWNFHTDLPIAEDSPKMLEIEVLDSDKHGKDKSLGKIKLNVDDLINNAPVDDTWVPLDGVKSGKLKYAADFNPTDDLDIIKRGSISGPKRTPLEEDTAGERKNSSLKDRGDKTSSAGLAGTADRRRSSSKNDPNRTGQDGIPGPGVMHVNVIQAKDLMKADLMGKSDPYAVVSTDKDKHKSKVVKNNQSPHWNYEVEIPVNEDSNPLLKIEIFDNDKFGKDKSLGHADLDMGDIANGNPVNNEWIPLKGAKSGQIQVSADYISQDDMDGGDGDRRKSSKQKNYGVLAPGHDSDYGDDSSQPKSDRKPSGQGAKGVKDRLKSMMHRGDDNQDPSKKKSISDHADDYDDGNSASGRFDGNRGENKENDKLSNRRGDENDDNNFLPGNVALTILQAKDLPKTDLIGKSDPYAVVTYGNDKAKTPTVNNDQNPKWDYALDIPVDPTGPGHIQIDLYDEDRIGKDEPLGSAELDISELANSGPISNKWIPLDGVKSGQLQLSAEYEPDNESSSPRKGSRQSSKSGPSIHSPGHRRESDSSAYSPGHRRESDSDVYSPGHRRESDSDVHSSGHRRESDSRVPRTREGSSDLIKDQVMINLKIAEGKDLISKDLIGKSDPYAIITCGNEEFKTNTVKNSKNPRWNFEENIIVDPQVSDKVKIEVFDEDRFGKDKSLGSMVIDINDLDANGPLKDDWIPLDGVKSGELRISAEIDDDSFGGEGPRDNSRKGSRLQGPAEKKRSSSRKNSEDDPTSYRKPSDSNLSSRKSSGEDPSSHRKPSSDSYSYFSSRKSSSNVPDDDNLNIHLNIIQGKDLANKDKLGKSDPYAVVTYGNEKFKTKAIKNNQNPEWNFEADIPYNKFGPETIDIDVYDKDRFDRDKRLGSVSLDVNDLISEGGIDKSWIPLSDSPSQQLLIAANVEPTRPHDTSSDRRPSEGGAHSLKKKLSDIDLGKSLGSRKSSSDNDRNSRKPSDYGMSGSKSLNRTPSQSGIDEVQPGKIHLNIVQGKDLMKGDKIGKSDPYLVVTYGNEKVKSSTIKNSQDPEFHFETDIDIPDGGPDYLKIEVFDRDRFGKDKPLGSANIDIPDLQKMQSKSDMWIDLDCAKSGQLQLGFDFEPDRSQPSKSGESSRKGSSQYIIEQTSFSRKSSEIFDNNSNSRKGSNSSGRDTSPRKPSTDQGSRKGSGGAMSLRDRLRGRSISKERPDYDKGSLGEPRLSSPPPDDKLGTIKLDLVGAKNLIKADLIGKSDPYAIVTYGTQQYKTEVINNSQNPEWNIQCNIDVPDQHERNIHIALYDSDSFGKDKPLGEYNVDVGKIMNAGGLNKGWQPLSGAKSGEICVGAEFVPNYGNDGGTFTREETRIYEKYEEVRRSSKQYQEVNLNRIPLPSAGGHVEASIRRPSGKIDIPNIDDNNSGTLSIRYQPEEEGLHYLEVRYNGDQVQGSPFKFHVHNPNGGNHGQAHAYGSGLTHGVSGEPAYFTISTKGAGAGGLSLAVEGPSKAEISCNDNKDGTVDVKYLPTAPGEYKITAKFADKHIPGSPFTCKVTGEGKKRNQISVGTSSELQLPGDLSEADIRSLKAFIQSPSGGKEQCFLKRLPKGNIGISFTPREVGEHLVSVMTRSDKHIANSPFKIVVNAQEVGDAQRVKVSGEGLEKGRTHVFNQFQINTKSAGYGGLSLSIEGPSKAEISCKDNEDGTLDVDYKPTEPGFYIVNIKFADAHIPGSPFQVPISGEGLEKQTENIQRVREAVPVKEVGSECRLTFKMPGIQMNDLEAKVTSPGGMTSQAQITELEEGVFAVNFVPHELGIHTVAVRYRSIDIPGSPFQFTVGPLQDSGAHRVHAGGPGLERGVEREPAEFNVWTREAGPGSLTISVEGPSKAQIKFIDRKDGSCYVSYIVEEPGEYSVGLKFNDEHIPTSPFRVLIVPKSEDADKVRISNLESDQVRLNSPQTFLLNKNGASGNLECKIVSPYGREDDCFISQIGQDEYSVRFVPREEGIHYLHARLDGVHVPGSPFKMKVGGGGLMRGPADGSGYHQAAGSGRVRVSGRGVERVNVGQLASFLIDTTEVGAGTLSVTVDGPSKVEMDCVEVEKGYEVSYTPTVAGEYIVTVKYNGTGIDGSPFKIIAYGGTTSTSSSGEYVKARRESTSMTMETIQHTLIRQESTFQESAATNSSTLTNSTSKITSRSSSRQIPIQFSSDASECTMSGDGLDRPMLGKQNVFTVDCSRGGTNVLFVGVYGPSTPCEEVFVKHIGGKIYNVSYRLKEPGQYVLYVKWGDQHVPGSPYNIEV